MMMVLKSTVRPRLLVVAAIVKDLQQNVEHIRVSFFHLIKQHNAVGMAAHSLCSADHPPHNPHIPEAHRSDETH